MSDVVLRPAVAGDAGMVLAWRNDPWIVALSAERKTVEPTEHAVWFESVLDPTRHLLYIVQSSGVPAGTVRLDRAGEQAIVTIFLMQRFTGRGVGVAALEAACQQAAGRWPEVRTITARIRRDNHASQKAFMKAGFTLVSTVTEEPRFVVMQRRNVVRVAA